MQVSRRALYWTRPSLRLFSSEPKTPLETSMVDVSGKQPTVRVATAQCQISMNTEAYTALRERTLVKGDAIAMAEVAGLMASKKTSELIPLCHQIALDYSKIKVLWDKDKDKESERDTQTVTIQCTTQVTDKTGCEMESLVGATMAALTIYDMCKSLDKFMVVGGARLLSKTGGKSGDVRADQSCDGKYNQTRF